MPYRKNCVICSKAFTAKRSHAQTCSEKCRKKKQLRNEKNKELKRKRQQIKEAEKKKLGETLRLQIEWIEGRNEFCDQKIEQLQEEERVLSLEELPKLDAECSKLEGFHEYLTWGGDIEERLKEINDKNLTSFNDLYEFDFVFNSKCKKLQYVEHRINRIPELVNNWIKVKEINNERIKELDNIRFTDNYKLLSPKEVEGILAKDLLKKEFISFRLDGNLGYFLGDLDRSKTAITVTGDSGTGKSHFVLYLAEMFLKKNFTVRYFSLEMKFGRVLQEMIEKYDCGGLDIADSGTMADVKKAAKNFDVVIIDSFSKLSTQAKDFDLLTEAHKETIFISIFQKTNSGKMRGGSAILFDSFMTIEIIKNEDEERMNEDGKHERIAKIEKSRNGRTGWEYSITYNEIIKEF